MHLSPLEASVIEIALRTAANDFAKDSARTEEDAFFLKPFLDAAESLLNKYYDHTGGADGQRYRLTEDDEIVKAEVTKPPPPHVHDCACMYEI